MLNQIVDYQMEKSPHTEKGIFIKSDREIINYLKRRVKIESKVFFRFISGIYKYNSEIEAELRNMLRDHGYHLRKMRSFKKNYYYDTETSYTSIWHYSIEQFIRPGCYPCGIPHNHPWMSRCLHWRNCHYGQKGQCELALITMN